MSMFDSARPSGSRQRTYTELGYWDGTTLLSRLAATWLTAPESTAVVDRLGARTATYGELDHDSAKLAEQLRELGVTPGSVVSVQLPNVYEAVVAFAAIQRVGAVINPLLPNYRLKELSHVFSVARTRVLISPTVYRNFDHVPLAAGAAERSGIGVAQLALDLDSGEYSLVRHGERTPSELPGERARDADDVSEMIFTSGTEAQPKGIVHSENTANASVRAFVEHLQLRPEQTAVWTPSPVGHSTGLNFGVRLALYLGVPVVLQDRWDGAQAADLLSQHPCTVTLAATTFLKDLVDVCAARGLQLPSLSRFACGGAAVPAPLVEAAGQVGIDVLRLYGSTEALVVSCHRPGTPLSERSESDGVALPRVELEVRGEDDVPVEPGQPGELLVRGPNTALGYFADPERHAATFLSEGWVRTGDLVQIDPQGHLAVVGRKKEIIIRGGMNIAPREIEELLLTFAEIHAAVVVGVPDDRLGERCIACVVLNEGHQLGFEDMVARLRATGLASYKLPEGLQTFGELPVTPSGKVQKHVLRALLAQPTG